MVTSTCTRAVVRLDIGEPDVDTPPHIVDAAARALREGATRYVAPEGLASLRAAVADRLGERGCATTAERIVVGAGAKPLLCAALHVLVGAGDEVLIPDPGYPGYAAAVKLAGATAVPYPAIDGSGAFDLDPAAVAAIITPRTRVLVLNSPHNPTGGVCADETLDALAALAAEHDLHVISDEVYAAIRYDGGTHTSIAARPGMADRTVLVDSFSKTYAMTGWRLGFAHLPPALVAPVRAHLLHTTTCTPAFVQEAGIAALMGPQDAVDAMVRTLATRRDRIVAALRGAGVPVDRPGGAFYVFPRPGDATPGCSTRMAARLLDDHGIACASGASYGRNGEGHLRISFAAPSDVLDDVVRGMARLDARTGEVR